MSTPNPPPVKIPKKLLEDPESRAFFTALVNHLQSMWLWQQEQQQQEE